MFTILIACLKKDYLQMQLAMLANQEYKDFSVIVMDTDYKVNKDKTWITKKYPYTVTHLPLLHHVKQSKRCDYSIKNNLALLSLTNNFLFLSDTHLVDKQFTQNCAKIVTTHKHGYFNSTNITLEDSESFTVGNSSAPILMHDRKSFFYVLNGYDEAVTYNSALNEQIWLKYEKLHIYTVPQVFDNQVFHVEHESVNNFGKFWKKPCEKCSELFSEKKIKEAVVHNRFLLPEDSEYTEQIMYFDKDYQLPMFQCPNCGFGGCYEPFTYSKLVQRNCLTNSPDKALDNRTGRDLGQLYEHISTKIGQNIKDRWAYLKTTY